MCIRHVRFAFFFICSGLFMRTRDNVGTEKGRMRDMRINGGNRGKEMRSGRKLECDGDM